MVSRPSGDVRNSDSKADHVLYGLSGSDMGQAYRRYAVRKLNLGHLHLVVGQSLDGRLQYCPPDQNLLVRLPQQHL